MGETWTRIEESSTEVLADASGSRPRSDAIGRTDRRRRDVENLDVYCFVLERTGMY